jgi:hypothetical protein
MTTAASHSVMVCHGNMANTTSDSAVYAVCPPKATIVSSAKTNTKDGAAAYEWVSFNPSVVPTKFVIAAPCMPTCTCQGCMDMLANGV